MNQEEKLAWLISDTTNRSVFISGKAGTGKTTFLRNLRCHTKKRMIVVAPTGIAAINAGGVTIHSFFQLSFTPFLPGMSYRKNGEFFRFSKEKKRVINSIDSLVIDEVSMVRADVLDAIDETLRRLRHSNEPFGGVQVIMFGDLGQLSPVAKDEEWNILSQVYDTPYFFSSTALQKTDYVHVELHHIYRQGDEDFIRLLASIRSGVADQSVLDALNSRYIPGFVPKASDQYINLVTHNAQAQNINDRQLATLPGKCYVYDAAISGNFPEMNYPTDAHLSLKKGAQVMFVKNDPTEKKYYNGMIGEIVSINDNGFDVREKESGNIISVTPLVWENTSYTIDEESHEIVEKVEGTFQQYPVKTAWAITIHKSQGLTFEHAMIDASRAFSHGQTYVALSRCKSLEGLVLTSPLSPSAIIDDTSVSSFSSDVKNRIPTESSISEMQRTYYLFLITELFDFGAIRRAFSAVRRIVDEHFYRIFPNLVKSYSDHFVAFEEKVYKVAGRFHEQYSSIVSSSDDYVNDTSLSDRILRGASYFYRETEELLSLVSGTHLNSDNKVVQKRIDDNVPMLLRDLFVKRRLLQYVIQEGFTVKGYLHEKALVALERLDEENEKGTRSRKASNVRKAGATPKSSSASSSSSESSVSSTSSDIQNEELYKALLRWRAVKSKNFKIISYMVVNSKGLVSIANLQPETEAELIKLPYIGKSTVEKYGKEILSIVEKHRK